MPKTRVLLLVATCLSDGPAAVFQVGSAILTVECDCLWAIYLHSVTDCGDQLAELPQGSNVVPAVLA